MTVVEIAGDELKEIEAEAESRLYFVFSFSPNERFAEVQAALTEKLLRTLLETKYSIDLAEAFMIANTLSSLVEVQDCFEACIADGPNQGYAVMREVWKRLPFEVSFHRVEETKEVRRCVCYPKG